MNDVQRLDATTASQFSSIGKSLSESEFTAAEIGALAHLYRGEVYRSTVWRTRLDTTTNWAVVVTGISLSISFGSTNASSLPLLLVGLLVSVFLVLEARRYRYFNVWRARARLLETAFFAPMLRGTGGRPDGRWNLLLAENYERPQFNISYPRAIGRRLRKSYCWVFGMQILAYFGKLVVHPAPLTNVSELLERAAIGPIPGGWVLLAGAIFHTGWIIFSLITHRAEIRTRLEKRTSIAIG